MVDVGLFHQPKELARVGREALHVPALPFGVNRVEGKRRLAGPGDACYDDQLLARNLDVDILEVMLAGTANDDEVVRHSVLAAGRSLVLYPVSAN